MVSYLRNPLRRPQALGLTFVALCGLLAAFAVVMLAGSKTGAVLSVGLTVGPALLYVMIVSPIAFPFSLYAVATPFDSILDLPAFGTATKLIGILTAAGFLFYIIRTKKYCDPPRNLVLWVLLFLWMLASMFWAYDTDSSQKLLPTAFELLALYIVAAMVPVTIKQLRIACGATAAGGIFAAAYGYHLYRSGIAEFKDRLWVHTDTSSWNPDHFANSLLLPIAICLICVLWSRNLLSRIAAGLGIGIMLITMVYTGARGAVVGLFALIVYLIWKDRHRIQLAVVGGILGIAAVIAKGPAYLQRWQEAAQNGGSGRVSIWHVAWHAFQQNWLYGAGFGNFPFAYDRAFIGVFQTFFADWHRASHNIIIGYGVELGIIGLVLLLLAWWGQFRMLRGIGDDDERWPYRLGLEGATLALFFSGMFADIMSWKYLWLAFMLVAFTYNASPQRVYHRAGVGAELPQGATANA